MIIYSSTMENMIQIYGELRLKLTNEEQEKNLDNLEDKMNLDF